jgi:hypothetical protein
MFDGSRLDQEMHGHFAVRVTHERKPLNGVSVRTTAVLKYDRRAINRFEGRPEQLAVHFGMLLTTPDSPSAGLYFDYNNR